MTYGISLSECISVYDKEIGAGPLVSPEKLEAALTAPFAGFGGQEFYPTPEAKGAKFIESINIAHAYEDGNKRLSWIIADTYLTMNGLVLEADQDESYRMVMDLVQHRIAHIDMAVWLTDHVRLR